MGAGLELEVVTGALRVEVDPEDFLRIDLGGAIFKEPKQRCECSA